MILSYNVPADLMQLAYYDEQMNVRVFLYDDLQGRWLSSFHDFQWKSLTGFRNREAFKNGISEILHDDGVE